jgi:hypothetical protein
MNAPLFIAPIDIKKDDIICFASSVTGLIANDPIILDSIERDGKEIWNREEQGNLSGIERRKEFIRELTSLIEKFNEKNPDLFVAKIALMNNQYATGRTVLTRVDAVIEVQACKKL